MWKSCVRWPWLGMMRPKIEFEFTWYIIKHEMKFSNDPSFSNWDSLYLSKNINNNRNDDCPSAYLYNRVIYVVDTDNHILKSCMGIIVIAKLWKFHCLLHSPGILQTNNVRANSYDLKLLTYALYRLYRLTFWNQTCSERCCSPRGRSLCFSCLRQLLRDLSVPNFYFYMTCVVTSLTMSNLKVHDRWQVFNGKFSHYIRPVWDYPKLGINRLRIND